MQNTDTSLIHTQWIKEYTLIISDIFTYFLSSHYSVSTEQVHLNSSIAPWFHVSLGNIHRNTHTSTHTPIPHKYIQPP